MNAYEYYMSLEKYDRRYWKDERFLTKVVRSFAKKFYGLETNIKVEINGRLGRSLGRFVHTRKIKRSMRIEISRKLLEDASKQHIVQVVLHEAIHHILYELDKPYRDGDPYFENELTKQGSLHTGVIGVKMEREVYTCAVCEKVVAAKHRKSPSLLRSTTMTTCCRARVEYAGRMVI
jgi:SprT-like protein